MTYIFFLFNFKAKTQWNKGMSAFDSGNSVNCILLDVNLYETKEGKIIGPLYLKCTTNSYERWWC